MPTQTNFICPSGASFYDLSGVFDALNGGTAYGSATNYKVNGLDLSGIFHASQIESDRPNFNTGFKLSSGADLSTVFRRYNFIQDPIINNQPATITRKTTQSATFTVQFTIISASVSYQWKKDGSNLTGTGSSGTVSGAGSHTISYTINPVQMGDQGNYSVTLTGASVVNSNNARLNISPRIISTADPAGSYTLYYGNQTSQVLNLQITSADGETPLSYKWEKNGSTVSSTDQYTKNVANGDSGTYVGTVTNSYGSDVTGNYVISAVDGNPTISVQPQNQVVTNNTTATFSLTATSNGPAISYLWYKNSVSTGVTTASYTTSALSTANDTDTYYCRVSTAYGVVNSNTVSTKIKPYITLQPVGATVNDHDYVSLIVEAGGSGTLNFSWIKNGTEVIVAPRVGNESATRDNHTFQVLSNAIYNCKVTNSYFPSGTLSDTVGVYIIAPVVNITSPSSGTVYNYNQSVTLTSSLSQGTYVSYQWYFNGSYIPGATSSSYTFNINISNAGDYFVRATNGGGDDDSSTVTVYVNPYITSSPSSVSVNKGGNGVFNTIAYGSGTLTYTWYRSTDGGANYNTFGAANNYQYAAIGVLSGDNGYKYRCVVSSSISGSTSVTSDVATLTVVYVGEQYFNGAWNTYSGGTLTFTNNVGPYGMKATIYNYTANYYMWQKNIGGTWTDQYVSPQTGNLIPYSENADQFIWSPVITYSDAGEWRCKITNSLDGSPIYTQVFTIAVT